MAAETADGSAGGGGGRYAGLTHSVFGSGKPFMERSVTPGKKVRGVWRVDCRACSTSTSTSLYTLNCRAKARTPRRPMLQPAALGPRVAPLKRHPPRVPVGRGVGHLLRGVVASLGPGGRALSTSTSMAMAISTSMANREASVVSLPRVLIESISPDSPPPPSLGLRDAWARRAR